MLKVSWAAKLRPRPQTRDPHAMGLRNLTQAPSLAWVRRGMVHIWSIFVHPLQSRVPSAVCIWEMCKAVIQSSERGSTLVDHSTKICIYVLYHWQFDCPVLYVSLAFIVPWGWLPQHSGLTHSLILHPIERSERTFQQPSLQVQIQNNLPKTPSAKARANHISYKLQYQEQKTRECIQDKVPVS